MARIAGVDLPRNKQARIALTYIFGIGNPRALRILAAANDRSLGDEARGSREGRLIGPSSPSRRDGAGCTILARAAAGSVATPETRTRPWQGPRFQRLSKRQHRRTEP